MIIPSCVAFLPQGRKVIFYTAMGYAGGAPDSNNEGFFKKNCYSGTPILR